MGPQFNSREPTWPVGPRVRLGPDPVAWLDPKKPLGPDSLRTEVSASHSGLFLGE
jgi:hypothetical protein